MGHEDAFPPPRLSARYRFSQGTLARTRGNGRDAPKRAVSVTKKRPQGSTPCRQETCVPMQACGLRFSLSQRSSASRQGFQPSHG
jgi:hypothetical protein